jgi:hypothetical protein
MRGAPPFAALLLASAVAACGRGGQPPARPGTVKGPDGREYHLVQRGAYKAFYDRWGRLDRLEFDGNGDGRTDAVAHYDGDRVARRVDVDTDFDGRPDRFEEYDALGRLARTGVARHGSAPDLWVVPGPDGQEARREYDDDGDGRVDRTEVLIAGAVARVEIDSDRDGRADRFQAWEHGRMVAEEIDLDHDGRPDRRLRYNALGRVVGLESLAAR